MYKCNVQQKKGLWFSSRYWIIFLPKPKGIETNMEICVSKYRINRTYSHRKYVFIYIPKTARTTSNAFDFHSLLAVFPFHNSFSS